MKKYNEEFKKQAVRLINELGYARTKAELKVSEPTLRKWVSETNQKKALEDGRKYRSYTPEFKEEAVRSCFERGVRKTASALGVHETNLYRWKNKTGSALAHPVARDEKIIALQMESEQLRKDIKDIKAFLGFSKSAYTELRKDNHTEEGIVHTCKNCGVKYIARVPYQKYCSTSCRNAYHYSKTYKSIRYPIRNPSI